MISVLDGADAGDRNRVGSRSSVSADRPISPIVTSPPHPELIYRHIAA